MDFIKIAIGASILTLLLLVLPSETNDSKKRALLKSIKVSKPKTATEKAMEWVDNTFYELLHFDPNDSAQKLVKEIIYSVVIGVAVGATGVFLGIAWIGIIMGFMMLGLPIFIRWSNSKENKILYRESFYRVVSYIILYLSGGLNILKALEETERVISEDDIIRQNFLLVLKERKISGISGDNIIDSLEVLNRDYNLDEISQFISSLNLANTKGIAIVDMLKSQNTYIRKRQALRIQEKIAATDSKMTMLKTLFGIGTALAIFILPPIITAVIAFGGTL